MKENSKKSITKSEFRNIILSDYRIINECRQASLLGRRDVLSGKGSFGIFGDGKELAQIALSKVFKNGDFRAGYYRDQTFMMAIDQLTSKQMFSHLYGNPDLSAEPSSGSRQMMNHFGSRFLNDDGSCRNLMAQKNSTSDMACLTSQFPRVVGLAQASKVYRENKELALLKKNFTNGGNEVVFATIGNSSCAEGLFFEAINAIGVLQLPAIISIWDDDYGISVANDLQITKSDVSEVLKGFQRDDKGEGFEIIKVKAWDYPCLVETYEKAERLAREKHIPCIIHVIEMTQPTGHSTSGSHERYKNKERLNWEKDFDCITMFEEWIIDNSLATQEELETIKNDTIDFVKKSKKEAWIEYQDPIKNELNELLIILNTIASKINISEMEDWIYNLKQSASLGLFRKDFLSVSRKVLSKIAKEDISEKQMLIDFINKISSENYYRYSSKLYNETLTSVRKVEEIIPTYDLNVEKVDARIIIRDNFDSILSKFQEVMIFGEDVGKIGDVNQGTEGLQKKYGETRVSDTGIREATILGQGIGLSLRGLRPIAEIQYLDYLLYAFQTMADDLATLHYRTHGGQISPVIIRTRGHRLEGIWHSGSPMGMIINGTRGVNICVPRNMTKAAGFYNTLLVANEPALVIECLNSYRIKEKLPNNMGEFRTPLGKPEITNEGTHVTIVTYGSTWRIVMEATKQLEDIGISVEVIDVQTLVPFDLDLSIIESIKKTNRLLVVDEDVPGGASAYILQKIIEEQKAFFHLDSEPQTLTAKAHRPAYGKDGDYFSKPSVEDVFEKVYAIMSEVNPIEFPSLY